MREGRGPVFVLTLHRAGGTVLARVLNCHPELVIWGEHAGLINRLAEIDDMIGRVARLASPKTEAEISDFIAFPDPRLNLFEPWVNPFDLAGFRRCCRAMLEAMFRRGLGPGHRWGFKEIRYHRVLTARFLAELFSDARFVVLTRDLREVAVSTILARWSLRSLAAHREAMPEAVANAIVRDVTYALLVIEQGLGKVCTELGARAFHLDFEAMLDRERGFVGPLFGFLGCDLSAETAGRVERVLAVRAGASDRGIAFGGVLSADFIRDRVTALMPELAAELARDGIDKPRLVARAGIGEYSFLAGDHTMRERDCAFSSLFW
jgi:hypothetical protein